MIENRNNKKNCFDNTLSAIHFQDDIASIEKTIGKKGNKSIEKVNPARNAKFSYILLSCLIILLFLFLTLIISIKNDNRRRGINRKQCIENVVLIANKLRDGTELSGTMVCPASGEKYIIIGEEGEKQVYCPTPKRHNFKALRATEKRVLPEIIK
jgi:hypothetical protein